MLHSHICVYIHCVWTTLYRERSISPEIRPRISRHIFEYAQSASIRIDSLNLQPDHVHALVELKSDQSIDRLIKLLKGESSHWINSTDLVRNKFCWQRGYGAFSVGYTQLPLVRIYISGQDEHHRRKSFADEYDNMIRSTGINLAGTEQRSDGD